MSTHAIDIEFSVRVRQARHEQGWSQLDLAIGAEVPPCTISRLELGRGVTLRNALPIARELGINLMDL